MDEPVGLRPAMEAMFTIRPAPWRCMTGATALVHSIGPVRFTSRIFCHSSYVNASRSLQGLHLLRMRDVAPHGLGTHPRLLQLPGHGLCRLTALRIDHHNVTPRFGQG